MSVLSGCKPRKEVLQGDLDDAIFAADFGELVAGKAPAVYRDAKVFFQNTHPAKQLCKVVQAVFGRLADPKEGGATIRLSTGFGGGKTHTLMALWHLAKKIGDSSLGTDLLPAAGRPKKVTVVAIDASKAGTTIFRQHDDRVATRSLWGEIAYGLGETKALKLLGEADDPEHQPDEATLQKLFPDGPVLILLDELVIYMATLSERGQGNLLAFLNKLSAVVGRRPQTALIVTDPADQRAYAKEAARLGQSMDAAVKKDADQVAAAAKLDDLFGRKMSDFDPIGDESAKVIVRRLFEKVEQAAAQATSAKYHALYERVAGDDPGLIPAVAKGTAYAQRIVECYPFHPRLLDLATDRLGALQEFNKSRGTLRLFARILRTVWESKEEVDLITAGEIDWTSDRIQADLLQRLNRDSFKAAISADIAKHAAELDGDKIRGIHVRVASALLLESIPMQSNSGLDAAELTVAMLRLDEAGPEPSEALEHLVGVCWHTYPLPGGRGWQFRYEPNIIKQIEERMTDIPREDARSRVLAEAQQYFSGPAFKVAPWPTKARQVPESAELQLALCEDEKLASAVCAYSDDSEPATSLPRRFRNAIFAVSATQAALDSAIDRAQRLLAADAIGKDHTQGESGKLVREQLRRLTPDLSKFFRIQTCRAFDRIVFSGGVSYALDEQFQVSDEQMIQKAHGQSCLRKFLDAKNLIYQPGDAIDAGLFLKNILPGATPIIGNPDVYTAKAIHERVLSSTGLRLLPDGGVVRQTILKALGGGKIAVRLSDGRVYDGGGYVEGPEGKRRRIQGSLSSLPLDDSIQLTRSDSETAKLWTAINSESEIKDKGKWPPPPPPPPAGPTIATDWEKAIALAADRPLIRLQLVASMPTVAATLAVLTQPLGADDLKLTVTVGGGLRDGGQMNFTAAEVKPTHPAKPLSMAQTIFNAIGEGAEYEAELTLSFSAGGRPHLADQLRQMRDQAAEGVSIKATFEKSAGAGS